MNATQSCGFDDEALSRVRELDREGRGDQLLLRLLRVFEKSIDRMLTQLEQARAAADAKGVHMVAHTLKSSSAAVGALALSRQCALVEHLTRESRLDEAAHDMQQMILEAEAAREAARRLAAQLEAVAHIP
jgi:HPt (histidine-containing phosphotransfer) domain-containing protein